MRPLKLTPSDVYLSELCELMKHYNDAIAGFTIASSITKNPGLSKFLNKLSEMRKEIRDEIGTYLKENGGSPTYDRSFPGEMHNAIMLSKSIIPSNRDEDVVNDCVKEEERLIKEVDGLLERSFDEPLKFILERHKDRISMRMMILENI